MCLAIAIDAARRLMLIGSGVAVVWPGDIWAILNIIMLSVSGLLLWARVAQITRHNLRDRNHGQLLATELANRGINLNNQGNKQLNTLIAFIKRPGEVKKGYVWLVAFLTSLIASGLLQGTAYHYVAVGITLLGLIGGVTIKNDAWTANQNGTGE